MKNILVTGAGGLVGSAIFNHRPEHLAPLTAATSRAAYDLLKWTDVSRLFEFAKPEAVIHLAAKVGGVQANINAPATFFMENVTMNTHILEAARIHGVKKLICFLSTCVFPNNCDLPLQPRSLHDGPPHTSNYGYAFAKRMLAVQCQAYNEEYGTEFVPVIPCNIYGPNDNYSLENSHVVPALIRRFVTAKKERSDVTLWGTGAPLREFIFSRDVAVLTMAILEHYVGTEPIIISTGQEHSIKYLSETIAAATGFQGEIIWDINRPEGQHRKPSDNTPLREVVIEPHLPAFKFTSLEDGIKESVEWFFTNYPKVRGV